MQKKTPRGKFVRDRAGVWHYTHEKTFGTVHDAIRDALQHRPMTVPSWFWFNDTPAPMHSDDTVVTLYQRWSEWREAYQRGGGDLLKKLHELVRHEHATAGKRLAASAALS